MVIPGNGHVSGSQKGTEGEPQRIGQRKVVDVLLDGVEAADGPPAELGPAVHGEEHQGNGEEDGGHGGPHLGRQWRHERQEAGLLFHRLLDHDADAQLHEGSAEVDDTLPRRRYGDGTQRNVCLLYIPRQLQTVEQTWNTRRSR